MKVSSFSLGLGSQGRHTRVAVFFTTLLKVSDWVRNSTVLRDIKHPASLWSYSTVGSHVSVLPFTTFCQRNLVCFWHSVTYSTKERGRWMKNHTRFQHRKAKRTYSLFYYETPVLAYLIHVHRCVLLLISVFIILNIVFVKLSRFYLKKSTETH